MLCSCERYVVHGDRQDMAGNVFYIEENIFEKKRGEGGEKWKLLVLRILGFSTYLGYNALFVL